MAVSCTVFKIKRAISKKTLIFHTLILNLHDPRIPATFFQNCKTDCPSPLANKWCKSIAKKSNPLSRVHQRHRRQIDGSYHKANVT